MTGTAADVVASLPASRGDDCVLVGIDGLDGAGKSTFADALVAELKIVGRPAVRVSLDDFHHVRSVRYRRGRESPEGFYRDSFDHERLISDVLAPLGPGGSRRYSPRGHDLLTDEILEPQWRDAPAGAVAVIDGLFLHRPELRGYWQVSVWLDVPVAERERRMLARDGRLGPVDRYRGAGLLYTRECDPRASASLVIDQRA